MKTAVTIRTITAVKIMTLKSKTPKIFRDWAIITAIKQIATIAIKTPRKNSIVNFNTREKYIWSIIMLELLFGKEEK